MWDIYVPAERDAEEVGRQRYLMGYKYEGGYRFWIPRIGYLFTKGLCPCYPTMGPPPRSNATRQSPSHASAKDNTWTHDTRTYIHPHHRTQKTLAGTTMRRMERQQLRHWHGRNPPIAAPRRYRPRT